MEERFLKQVMPLVKYLRPHKKVLIISFSLTVISTALGMVHPLFTKVLIDRVLLGRDYKLLITLIIALISLLIVSFLVRVFNSYIYTRYSARVLFRMREDMFEHLQRVPLSFFSKRKIGDIYSRIATDMANIQALVTETIPNYLFDIMTCLITVSILLWLNWKMALLSFFFLPVAIRILSYIRPKLLSISKSLAENNADVAHFLFESLSGSSLIRALGAEELEYAKLQEKQSNILKILLRYQILGAFSGSVPTFYTVINTIVVFGYGGILVMKGSLTIGSLVAFSLYQGRVFTPLRGLMEGYLDMQKSKVAMNRVKEIMDVRPAFQKDGDIVLKGEALRGEIAFKQVHFAYEEEEPVLRGLSFHIPAGQVTAIVGPSGVGKSTICHLIMRLFDPDSGTITLDGNDLRKMKMGWLRDQIALVSQDTFLFHTTISENIRFSNPSASDAEIVEASRAACIDEFIQTLPDAYETVIGDRGVRLSGGQKQRISIARSILSRPKILILDEATAFLDASSEERLKETIRFLMKEKTIIVVSHHLSTVQGAEKIIALEKGRLVYEGPATDFLEVNQPLT